MLLYAQHNSLVFYRFPRFVVLSPGIPDTEQAKYRRSIQQSRIYKRTVIGQNRPLLTQRAKPSCASIDPYPYCYADDTKEVFSGLFSSYLIYI
ncbi:MAG: hypothetical protein RIQ72_606 [Candidatus Parcubacteria bacterium]|jgi:hypothetical protein